MLSAHPKGLSMQVGGGPEEPEPEPEPRLATHWLTGLAATQPQGVVVHWVYMQPFFVP